jgi:hypothetical protein
MQSFLFGERVVFGVDGFQIADALRNLAEELASVEVADGGSEARTLEVTSAEIELAVRAVSRADGSVGFVVTSEPGAKASESNAHRLRLALNLRGSVSQSTEPLVDDADNQDLLAGKNDVSASASRYDRSGAIEPLSREILRRRISDTFSGGYLTVIAIIQGVALGILLSTIQHQFSEATTLPSHLTVAGQGLATFAAIVIITQQYLILAALVRWTPTALDTVIPYALGAGEIGISLLVGHIATWWASFAVLLLVAIGAFSYSLIRGNANVFGDLIAIHRQYRDSLKLQIVVCTALAVVCVTISLLSSLSVRATWLYVIAPIVVLIGGVLIEIAGDRDKDDIFAKNGIPWWSFRLTDDGRARLAQRKGSEKNRSASPEQASTHATLAEADADSGAQS